MLLLGLAPNKTSIMLLYGSPASPVGLRDQGATRWKEPGSLSHRLETGFLSPSEQSILDYDVSKK